MYQFIGYNVILKRIKAIKFMMKDKTVPFRKKLLVALGIVYLFLPIDLIPPVLFPIAWMDDLVLWIWILWHLKDQLDKYWVGEKAEDLSKKYKDKDIIDNANYEVNVDDNKESN
ncbi:MAG: YkvA family protein [Aminipila sp.]